MTSSLKCSVIVPTYNRMNLLRCTLDSLAKQRMPKEMFEVLVVDDGSSDGTAEVAESFRESLNLRYYFQRDEGWRVAKARNVGVDNARAGICVFVDSGVMIHSGCLEAHVRSHESVSYSVATVGYVYGFEVDSRNSKRIKQAIDFKDVDVSIERMRKYGLWPDVRDAEFYARYSDDFSGLPAPWVMFWSCNASAPTGRIRSVGGFDEEFRSWGGEDLDLAYRLHLDGVRFGLDRQASAIHVPHHKNFEANERGAAENYRYMARKYDTPIMRLLPFTMEMSIFDINDVIIERGLPR